MVTHLLQESTRCRRARSIALVLVALLLAMAATMPAPAQTFNVLYNFSGGPGGYDPWGPLLRDKAGNLYGTTAAGGGSDCGTVFKLAKDGTESVLHSFTCGSDGAIPLSGLVLSGDVLYGTTILGGHTSGVVFAVNIKTRTETVLHTFTGGDDGARPYGGLVQDKAGNLYGCTLLPTRLYRVVPKSGKFTVVHRLHDRDGGFCYSDQTLSNDGNVLYGTMTAGGTYDWGTVFSLSLKSRAFRVLYNFTGASDGGLPYGPLSVGPDGVLYGATEAGGLTCSVLGGCGVVYKLTPKTGKETVLYAFTGGTDGMSPEGGVVLNNAGKLFGGTTTASSDVYGTIFELDPKTGILSNLHQFGGGDGSWAVAALIRDTRGIFYGITPSGGTGNGGVVFSIHP